MKKYILIIISILLLGCKSSQSNNLSKEFFTLNDFGKICLNNSEILLLSKASRINKKHFTSAIYGEMENLKICYPINDKAFNYAYWNNNKNFLIGKKINVYYKIYSINNRDVKVIYKIADE